MRILISGSSGFIGTYLIPFLASKGYNLNYLKRKRELIKDITILWHPERRIINSKALEGYDVVIHLAGENIATRKWTKRQKEKIYNSRIQDTNFLTQSILSLDSPPKLFLCASALGYYGHCGDEIVTEEHKAGEGFLAKVCKDWENEVSKANKKKIRIVNLRFGMILSPQFGILSKLLPVFKLGLGGKIGNGKQYMSWISIEDAIRAIEYIIKNDSIKGPVNITSNSPVPNEEFTRVLGTVISKPVIFSVPAFILRFVYGEMADELLLSSIRAIPKKLIDSGFTFRHETVLMAMQSLLRE